MNSWGGGHGRDSHTEWQVTTNHTTPLPEKSQSQSGNGFGNENDNHIKVVLVGAPGVGKTSMVQVIQLLYINIHTNTDMHLFLEVALKRLLHLILCTVNSMVV